MADRDGIWSRGGVPVEVLPDPLAPVGAPHQPPDQTTADAPPAPRKSRRSARRVAFYTIAAVLLLTLLWLIVTAPLSRALEPLDDPALLLLSRKPPIALGALRKRRSNAPQSLTPAPSSPRTALPALGR